MNQKLIWKIHQCMGLFAGVIIAFLGITGAVALFRPEIDQLLNPHLTQVNKPTGPKTSLNEAVHRVLSNHPDKKLFEVGLPKAHQDTWNIRLRPKENNSLNPMIWEVFVHPYTGEILGERNYFKTFSYFLRNLHVRFYEAEFGRQIVGLAGIALLISTITGFLIYGKFMKRQSFGEVRKKKIRTLQADLHKAIGISSLLFNLIIAITGAWLGLQPYLMDIFQMERPNQFTRQEKVFSPKKDKNFPLDYEAVLRTTKSNFPQMIPWFIRPSTNGEGVVQILGDVPGQAYERRSNKLVLDKKNRNTLHHYRVNKQGFGDQLFYVQEALHFGDFGGIPVKLLYCILAIASGFLSLSGFIIYLERTKKARQKSGSIDPLKKIITKWSLGIIAFCVVIGFLSIRYGIRIPSILVSTTFYGVLLFLLLKSFLQRIKKHQNRTPKTYTQL
ncbi:PepSY-associated TM helix domain-containing protein [Echinicola jeungdonensis]|uniref:PepSY-associated TM helix domain-containing protein n=1 Tax=Echinicola jeungdonensis TaxID=709343 RepID=A0ABV5J5Y8_9BACT|nr:PepSY-associated TM helix domain-containing protein [Echinicola jeungdonensis]MDN3668087.1 PepSY-associated TM helix domain-containing protein [Echinicola jeungdonensis]